MVIQIIGSHGGGLAFGVVMSFGVMLLHSSSEMLMFLFSIVFKDLVP